MAYAVERPLPRLGTFSQQSKEVASARQDLHDHRALRTLAVAQFLASVRKVNLSLAKQQELVEQAMATGILRPGPLPSRTYLWRLARRWEAGERSAVDYRVQPRSGRPKRAWDPRITGAIRAACEADGVPDVRALHRALQALAAEHDLDCPSYPTTARYVAARGRTAREAARHGARSAELGSTVNGHVPTRYTHDTWTLDAADAPWYARGYCDRLKEWVVIRQTILAVRDYQSGGVIGYHVVDPTRRRDASGRRMRTGYTSDDVIAAFLSTTCRELAPEATAAFAGHLCRRLRIDNHPTHAALRDALTSLATHVTEDAEWLLPDEGADDDALPPLTGALADEADRVEPGSNVEVPKLPVRRPKNRGRIETLIGFMKRLCQDLPHSVDKVIPLERITAPLGSRRTAQSNTASNREVRVDPIDVMQLPTAAQAAALFGDRVRYFNTGHVNRLYDATAETRYHEFFPAHPRSGRDFLLALESHTAYVSPDGITYQQDKVTYAFAPEARWRDQAIRLPLDAKVTYKRDPLGRGLFARVLDKLVFIPPAYVVAEIPGRAKSVAVEQAVETRVASDLAVLRRAEEFDGLYGPGAAEANRVRAADQVLLQEARESAKRAEERADAAERSAQNAATIVARFSGGDTADVLDSPDRRTRAPGDPSAPTATAGSPSATDTVAPGTSSATAPPRPSLLSQSQRPFRSRITPRDAGPEPSAEPRTDPGAFDLGSAGSDSPPRTA